MSITATSKRIWSLCHVLRDDGVVYHKYLSELTYLLFLKVAAETGREDLLPDGCRWNDLLGRSGPGMLGYYRKMLTSLGEDAPNKAVQEIFRFPTTVFNHEENLRKVVKGINLIDWHEAKMDGLGAIYESLLQRSAAEARSGAGQYFTPRALVDAIVTVMQPTVGEVVQDPAAGTAGFLISAHEFILRTHGISSYDESKPKFQAVEIEGDTYRLCLMNMFLHGMDSEVIHGDALTSDVAGLTPANLIIANPPFGSSAGGARARREDLPYQTSNKQLLFLQHIVLALTPGGRAAVIVPDNVLFEDNVGREVRTWLMNVCRLHTILRLPTGIFYAQGVQTNVLFFTRAEDGEVNATKDVWVYDLRSRMPPFGRNRAMTLEDFRDFITAFGTSAFGDDKRNDEGEDGRFRVFNRNDISERSDNLDISWVREDEKGLDLVLQDPEAIASAIIDHLRAALLDVEAVVEGLTERDEIQA